MVAKNQEHFESAGRYWSGKPSLAAVDAIVERMKAKERERLEICLPKPTPKDWHASEQGHSSEAPQGQEVGL